MMQRSAEMLFLQQREKRERKAPHDTWIGYEAVVQQKYTIPDYRVLTGQQRHTLFSRLKQSVFPLLITAAAETTLTVRETTGEKNCRK
jgi:hypothetical protein